MQQQGRLAGVVALVTGSSKGIGRGIAERFAREGADIVVNYRSDREGAEEVVDAARAAGRRAIAVEADVSEVAQATRLVERTIAEMGRLDVLVNNAGIEKEAPFWEVSEEDYDQVLAVNLKGSFFMARAAVRHFRDTGRPGRIINISSVHEDLAFPRFAPYAASKGGLRMLMRSLAVELGPLGIRVNNIAPGATRTAINEESLSDPGTRNALLEKIPLGRIGEPGDVAGVAVFLASADADYVTGATFTVDGGLLQYYEE
jgi:glucose 1-dehydrogenase